MLEEAFKQFFGTFQEKYETTLIELQNKVEFLESKNSELQNKVEYLESQKLESDQRIKQLEESIEELRAKKHEVYYQRKLEKLLGGNHYKTPAGEIDILTNTTLYEIKSWKGFKHAYGQLKSYAKYVPGKQLALIFFGKCHMKKAFQKEYLEDKLKENIEVYQVHDIPDGNVSLELLNRRPGNMPYVVNGQGDIIRFVTEFINQECELEIGNKTMRVFTVELWLSFNKWQIGKKITPQIKQLTFYRAVTEIVKYDCKKKVRMNHKNSLGWYGIKMKEQPNT